MMRHLLHLSAVLLAIGSLIVPSLAHGQATETVLHHFAGAPTDGSFPMCTLVPAADGNFYGTTRGGGNFDDGTVFKITPSGTVTILHQFQHSPDGANPYAGLIQGADGNFYGTTRVGGSYTPSPVGTVFKITPTGTITILYSFASEVPEAGLIQATDGYLYGTTTYGGTDNGGTIFKISTSGSLTILHSFARNGVDGLHPNSPLIQASDGNFYGVTPGGGPDPLGAGTIFKMTPSGSLTILHNFRDGSVTDDGGVPQGGLIQGSDGNFYGTTSGGGGTSQYGVVFKMTPSGTVTILHRFHDGSVANDGTAPFGALIQAVDGNFYGTTFSGSTADDGTVFAMTPSGSVTVLLSFGGPVAGDYGNPVAGVVQSGDGYLYGTTLGGSVGGNGTVYKLAVPSILAAVNSGSTDTPALPTWGLLGLGLLLLLAAARSLSRQKAA